MKELVIFDIDGTLLKGQSQKLLLNYVFKNKLIGFLTYLKIYLWFILYKAGIEKNPKKIMEYAYFFIQGKTEADVELIIKDFFNTTLKKYIFNEAVDVINSHKLNGRKIILLSNVVEILVREIANSLDIKDYIGTKLEVIDGKFTGKILDEIVYGKEKIMHLDNFIKNNDLSLSGSWSYGDHISDLCVLEKTEHPFAVNPDNDLRREAKKNNWPILIFKTFIYN